MEIIAVFNHKQKNEERFLIYADLIWTIKQLKKEIWARKLKEGDENWEPEPPSRLVCSCFSGTLKDDLTLRHYSVSDGKLLLFNTIKENTSGDCY